MHHRELKALLDGQLLPAVLGGSLGVRLSFTLAVHMCVAVHHPGTDREKSQQHPQQHDLLSGTASGELRPTVGSSGAAAASDGSILVGGHHAGAAKKHPASAAHREEGQHTQPPLLLLLAYPSQVVHFLAFGVFSAEAPTGPPGSRVAVGGAKGAARAAGGPGAGRGGKAVGAAVFVEPAVLLPARVAFCAFLDLVILRCRQQAEERELQSGRGSQGCSTAVGADVAAAAAGQAFIDDVALRLLDVVRGAGPYAWVASREAGQASWLNSCKVQAWQALCLLCRGLSKAAAEKVWGVDVLYAGGAGAVPAVPGLV